MSRRTRVKPRLQPSHIKASFLSSAGSFQFITEDCTNDDFSRLDLTADLSIVSLLPLLSCSVPKTSSILEPRQAKKHLVGLIPTEGVSAITVPIWANQISNLVNKERLISAIVLRVNGTRTKVDIDVIDELFWQLNKKGVPCLLNLHHDNEVFQHVNFSLVSGIIIDNACILPNGERRDYFRSRNLREMMAKCAGERLDRPGFFIGFHDVWDTQPSAAVVCRATRIASHLKQCSPIAPLTVVALGQKQGSKGWV